MREAELPMHLLEWIQGTIESRWTFLLCLNLFLLLVGCFLDIFSATFVVVPLILPLGLAYGVDPVHLGIIFVANLELGYLTPPVGLNLFIINSMATDTPISETYRGAIPFVLTDIIRVAILATFPAITLWLVWVLDAL